MTYWLADERWAATKKNCLDCYFPDCEVSNMCTICLIVQWNEGMAATGYISGRSFKLHKTCQRQRQSTLYLFGTINVRACCMYHASIRAFRTSLVHDLVMFIIHSKNQRMCTFHNKSYTMYIIWFKFVEEEDITHIHVYCDTLHVYLYIWLEINVVLSCADPDLKLT